MIKTFTWVKKRNHLSAQAFFERWVEHTKEFDLVDHPNILKNRLTLLEGHPDYVGLAENHWPCLDDLLEAGEFYQATERGRAHWADLSSFMDIDNSPTVIVTRETEIDQDGIHQLVPPPGETQP
jgi:hypothetical protein